MDTATTTPRTPRTILRKTVSSDLNATAKNPTDPAKTISDSFRVHKPSSTQQFVTAPFPRPRTISQRYKIRQRDETGHQTAILATDYRRPLGAVAVAMFARWCQENFFQYMSQHYGLDRLIEYGTPS